MCRLSKTQAIRLPEAIVWDLDGTLIDSAPDLAQALNRVLNNHGHPALDQAQVRNMIGGGATHLIQRGFAAFGQRLKGTVLQEMVAEFMPIYTAGATDQTLLFDGTRQTLQYFSNAGIVQGICTNKPERITRIILADLGIQHFFGAVVGGDTTTARKPDPLPLQTCLGMLDVRPAQGLMIGDSGVDVAAARAIGMPVGVVSFGYSRQAVAELGADFLIDALGDLSPRLAGDPAPV